MTFTTHQERAEYIRQHATTSAGGTPMKGTELATRPPSAPPAVAGDVLKARRLERLTELEGLIGAEVEKFRRQGTEAFWTIGQALHEVEHQQLWRETHPTFAAWLKDKSAFTPGHARKLVDFAQSFKREQLASAPMLSLNAFFAVEQSARKAEAAEGRGSAAGKAAAEQVRQAAVDAARDAPTPSAAKAAATTAAHDAVPAKAKDTPLDHTHPDLQAYALPGDTFALTPRIVPGRGSGVAVDARKKNLGEWRPGAMGRVPVGHDTTALCFVLLEGGKFEWWWAKNKRPPAPKKPGAPKRGK